MVDLKEEVKKLKEKLKKKSEKLIVANKKLIKLEKRLERHTIIEHRRCVMIDICNSITANLDRYTYEVKYEYDYEPGIFTAIISSYGSRWLSDELAYFLSNEIKDCVYKYEIKIISAKKLW